MAHHHTELEKKYILWAKVISGECHLIYYQLTNLLAIEALGENKPKLSKHLSSLLPRGVCGHVSLLLPKLLFFSTHVSSPFSSHIPFQCCPVFSFTFLLPRLLMCALLYTFLPVSLVPRNYHFFLYTIQQRHHRLLSLV